ncbi:4Fe-4S binding protein [Rhodalgimonas zhirmunskyi]|uniref:4Fe-4S binding protein n=1 Tax=Rhodalgimonas zhirmunskyi TaxID=2964767 RepID=A0AAJ1U8X2_9RHOB|nr:4Fe-4S binding protein [Rhodoalgimonas zhirmunskyi]MDQ2095129.1 4Fe-4S binding protein [Rhodoalgimonas zhirmunskyi]
MIRLRLSLIFLLGFLAMAATAQVGPGFGPGASEPVTAPDKAMAESLLQTSPPLSLTRIDEGVPGWTVHDSNGIAGYIGSTWEIAASVGYSGRPLEVLIAISPEAVITGAKLVRHNEPVLTLGISDEDIAKYVSGFAGHDLRKPFEEVSADLPDVISRATVSTGVIRDGILRSARTLAAGRGLIDIGGGIDRLTWHPATWGDLIEQGGLSEASLGMEDAAKAFAAAKVPVPAGEGDFLHLWAGLADPPTVGQNLLGQQEYTAAVGGLNPGETVLLVISSGLYSHRGTGWRRSGVFDRLTIVQGETRQQPLAADYHMIKRLRIDGAPEVKEISLFKLPEGIDPILPFTVEVRATRPAAAGGDIATVIATQYTLPEAYRTAPPPAPEPLWRRAWVEDTLAIGVTGTMLVALALLFLAQEWITRRPRLWRGLRLGFLSVTLVVLGWGFGGQLSVVQVVAFLHSLLNGFRWETFLIEPVIFMLWAFVALGLLFWGRGVYCGWLCPFGALQELLNAAAVRLGIRQIAVPQALHERLWIIKYTAFVGIVALSFYSMHDALVVAEIEPFKTAISMRMMRAWPFVLFVLLLLGAGLFIERFFCRYLCPLGAGLAIPAKLKIFDWLHRRPQCGRECRLCETKCTVGAIDSVGRINPNECVLCLRCQVIMNDDAQCPVLKRRARSKAAAPAPQPVPQTPPPAREETT